MVSRIQHFALAILVTFAVGCAHTQAQTPTAPPAGPQGGAQPQAGVGVTAVGPRGSILPILDREPFVASRGAASPAQPITLTWRLDSKIDGEVTVRILRYQKVDFERMTAADALHSLAKAAAYCPLANAQAQASAGTCNCDTEKGTASCKFRTADSAVFSYDICVQRRGDLRPSCLDPFGIIN